MATGIPWPTRQLFPLSRGQVVHLGQGAIGVARLTTDSIGNATVTFLGVPAASEIRVYSPSAVEVAGIESCAADQTLVWPAYQSGSPNNTVRIVILHPDFKIKEFSYVSLLGAQNLPIQPEPDRWFSNP